MDNEERKIKLLELKYDRSKTGFFASITFTLSLIIATAMIYKQNIEVGVILFFWSSVSIITIVISIILYIIDYNRLEDELKKSLLK